MRDAETKIESGQKYVCSLARSLHRFTCPGCDLYCPVASVRFCYAMDSSIAMSSVVGTAESPLLSRDEESRSPRKISRSQKLTQKKKQLESYTKTKKLERLSHHSQCKVIVSYMRGCGISKKKREKKDFRFTCCHYYGTIHEMTMNRLGISMHCFITFNYRHMHFYAQECNNWQTVRDTYIDSIRLNHLLNSIAQSLNGSSFHFLCHYGSVRLIPLLSN